MDSLTLKIQSFLSNAGSPEMLSNTTSKKTLEMVKYFEEEYDLRMMSFLEREWVTEQVDRDLFAGVFSDLRSRVPEHRLPGFDAVVSAVCSES